MIANLLYKGGIPYLQGNGGNGGFLGFSDIGTITESVGFNGGGGGGGVWDETLTSPVIQTGLTGPIGFTGWEAADMAATVAAAILTPQGPGLGPLDLRGLLGRTTQQAQIQAGLTRIQGKCAPARRRFKIVMDAEGNPHAVSICPPRRMNMLNQRALGRAARRLAGFQRIASGIEKIINTQLCRKKRRTTFACAPRSSARSRCR